MKKLIASAVFFLLVSLLLSVSAESQQTYFPLSDPYIPEGESSSYLVVNKKSSVKINETIHHDRTGNKYNIKVSAPLITRELTILKKTMTPVELTIITRQDTYILTTRKNVKFPDNNQKRTGKLTLLSASDIPYALRGYPFKKSVPVEIIFLNDQGTGNDESPFKVTAEAAGEETLSIAGREAVRKIPCYVLEIKYHISGFMSLFRSMFPKTKLWYSKESPHYLVKYENKGGRGTAGNMVMTINRYSGWK